jgi:hypothetical protein
MKKTLWVLSEERPKIEPIKFILEKFSLDNNFTYSISELRVLPVQNKSGDFSFWYEIVGFTCSEVERVLLRIVSGSSSFIDFLIFYQESMPQDGDRPIFLVEETKTDDAESRNTGIFQRASKFVYAELLYPKIDLNIFYNLQVEQKKSQTGTNIFGTRCLSTLGVKIAGKVLDPELNEPFKSLEDMIHFKNSMKKAPKGNVPILIEVVGDELHVSGKLLKADSLSNDPNIGALTLIGSTARKLGWEGEIVVTKHGLSQKHVGARNKFVRIASAIGMSLEGLKMPKTELLTSYWHYNTTGEKLATIFVHIIVTSFTDSRSIFENHAGSEKGYFITADNKFLPLQKYVTGIDPRKSLDIPDLIILNSSNSQIVNIEGKIFSEMELGIQTLLNYDDIEREYIRRYYPGLEIERSLVLFGSKSEKFDRDPVGLVLTENGKVLVGKSSPSLFIEALNKLDEFWKGNNYISF